MIEKKMDKVKHENKPRDDGVELENQFILRLPEAAATALHEALETGNLKDRIAIKMDADLRYGELRFDQWMLYAKILDLPTVIECLKTIDNKSFYKSADICQIMICKEEPDIIDPEKESPNKGKKKDPNKVDKKYLWPHGITPPCKNVRKRRFRKTLKKKNVEAPEIEKEVKRLLRIDNDAVKVDYEIINEDLDMDDKRSSLEQNDAKDYNDGDEDYNDVTFNDGEKNNDSSSQKDVNIESDADDEDGSGNRNAHRPHHHQHHHQQHHHGGVGEHDIFGEEVSSSEDEEDDDRRRRNSRSMRDLEEISRLSADDSRMSDYSNGGGGGDVGGSVANANNNDRSTAAGGDMINYKDTMTEFNKSMFSGAGSPKSNVNDESKFNATGGGSNSNLAASSSGYYEDRKHHHYDDDYSSEANAPPQLSVEQINAKIAELRRQNDDLKVQQAQKAQEISSIQNPTLKQRMQETLDNLLSQMIEKELEIKDYENML